MATDKWRATVERNRRMADLLRELWDVCGETLDCEACPRRSEECWSRCWYDVELRKLGVLDG